MPGIVLDARIKVDHFREDNCKSATMQCSMIGAGQGTFLLRRQTAGVSLTSSHWLRKPSSRQGHLSSDLKLGKLLRKLT